LPVVAVLPEIENPGEDVFADEFGKQIEYTVADIYIWIVYAPGSKSRR
jgi:hypothetical protein